MPMRNLEDASNQESGALSFCGLSLSWRRYLELSSVLKILFQGVLTVMLEGRILEACILYLTTHVDK